MDLKIGTLLAAIPLTLSLSVNGTQYSPTLAEQISKVKDPMAGIKLGEPLSNYKVLAKAGTYGYRIELPNQSLYETVFVHSTKAGGICSIKLFTKLIDIDQDAKQLLDAFESNRKMLSQHYSNEIYKNTIKSDTDVSAYNQLKEDSLVVSSAWNSKLPKSIYQVYSSVTVGNSEIIGGVYTIFDAFDCLSPSLDEMKENE